MIQYSYQISQTNSVLGCVSILLLSLSESRITRKGKGMEEWKNGRGDGWKRGWVEDYTSPNTAQILFKDGWKRGWVEEGMGGRGGGWKRGWVEEWKSGWVEEGMGADNTNEG